MFKAAGLLSILLGAQWASAQEPSFFLRENDVVVFYGDSITEQNFYNQWVELYTATRFPGLHVSFYGAGVGGDRVSGGFGGSIEQRLSRDVLALHPTVITVMLGMNDGRYTAPTAENEAAYATGYRHLLDVLAAGAPKARLVALGPSPVDEVTRGTIFAGGYNRVLIHFGQVDESLVKSRQGTFADLNQPVIAFLKKAQAASPELARTLIPDKIHPEAIAHWVMAEAVLESWHAPSLVSALRLDGASGQLVEAKNATVSELRTADGALLWATLEAALPLPLDRNNGLQAELFRLTDIQERLNQETLRVTGLPLARYELKIDDQTVTQLSSAELAAGINLADYATPMRSQAQQVGWLIRDRDEAHFIRTRMLIDKMSTAETSDDLSRFESSEERKIYDASTPKVHRFALVPTKP